ncbi:MAG: tRNA(fMet)-specific endonuclease VapC [Gammaproteobacteria bacterium]|nr:tRNA(fMet)-specific endonuclease VapC [Gammaproteobacteria bacterium]
MPRVAVVDTNVLVGGLLAGTPSSPPAVVVDGMLAGRFPFLLSPPLLAEYRVVLLRPRLRLLHGLSDEEADYLLVELVANAIWHELPSIEGAAAAPDPGDDHLWHLLNTVEGALLVTGDRLLLDNPPDFASVLSPRSFMDLVR